MSGLFPCSDEQAALHRSRGGACSWRSRSAPDAVVSESKGASNCESSFSNRAPVALEVGAGRRFRLPLAPVSRHCPADGAQGRRGGRARREAGIGRRGEGGKGGRGGEQGKVGGREGSSERARERGGGSEGGRRGGGRERAMGRVLFIPPFLPPSTHSLRISPLFLSLPLHFTASTWMARNAWSLLHSAV